MEWSGLKKYSAALTPMNDECLSIQTTGSSRLAANVSCLDWPDPPTTTNQCLSVIPLWRSCQVDAISLGDPSSGSRRIVHYLGREGIPTSRDHVRNLICRTGLRAIYQKLSTTIQGSSSGRFPCLVDFEKVTSIVQILATDITFMQLRKGFLFPAAIMDLFSRNVLTWKLSNSLDT